MVTALFLIRINYIKRLFECNREISKSFKFKKINLYIKFQSYLCKENNNLITTDILQTRLKKC